MKRPRKLTAQLIAAFELGENIPGKPNGGLKGWHREYLIAKANYTCQECGFKKQNPFSKRWIIEVDHLDGNWQNNTKGNLRVICPNCSAATSTYKAMNHGNGRKYTPTRRKKAGF